MKKLLVLLIDVIIVLLSIWLSFVILNQFDQLDNYRENIAAFYKIAPAIAPIYLILAYVFGMLNLQKKSITENLYTLFIVSMGLTVSIMAIIYLFREKAEAYPRSVIFLSPILYYIFLAIWRLSIQKAYLHSHGIRQAIIIGQDTEIIKQVLKDKYHQFYNILGEYQEWNQNVTDNICQVHDIFITDDVPNTIREKIILFNNDYPEINVYYIPRIADISIINSKLFPFGDLPIHNVRKLHLKSEEKIVKRIIDIIVSSILLIISLPIFIIIAILIKSDGGPVFFVQERLTRHRRVFKMYKFRSMYTDAEKKTGPTLATQNDNRITPIGKILRSTRLDELPQLWNILMGDMSLVGPRPEREIFASQIETEIPEFKYRLNVKAGLTGFAQIMGKYNTDFKQKLHYDLYYINNFSIFKDFLIMLQTIKVIFWKENTEGVKENTSQRLQAKAKK